MVVVLSTAVLPQVLSGPDQFLGYLPLGAGALRLISSDASKGKAVPLAANNAAFPPLPSSSSDVAGAL